MRRNRIISSLVATTLALSSLPVLAVETRPELNVKYLSSYSTGRISEDGAAAEIVKYNPDNKQMYVINGVDKVVDVAKINSDGTTTKIKTIDLSSIIPEFTFGDVTSIDISTEHKVIAMAVQEEAYDKNGSVVILDYEGNLIKHVLVGVQPDMVTFTKDGKYILTADEGEPRNGYGENVIDPKGSVSIIDLKKGIENATSNIVDFTKFDVKRNELVKNNVILNKGVNPSEDLEPEYIAVSENGKMAYVSLQEANAIAILDIEKGEFVDVKGLGFKDHSLEGNELDAIKDKKIAIKNQENLYGVYMPDGITTYEVNGKTYLLTANEGDGREYTQEEMPHIVKENEFINIKKIEIEGKKVEVLDNSKLDGLEEDKNYIFGGRSFSIWDVDTMELVFDSGSDFEKITAERYPEFFNCSNKNVDIDDRSGKKGPEPEDVKVGVVDGQAYAFVGLERIGGLMVYNISNPKEPSFMEYINTRDFSDKIKGDSGPEGICFIDKEHSVTENPMVLVSNEISGTVSVLDISKKSELQINKISASTNYAMAVEISKKSWESAEDVVLVNSNATVDALMATSFAKSKNAPILLTGSEALNSETKEEILRLSARNIHIIGGTGIVSDKVKSELEAMDLHVSRLGGSDRYSTSLEVAKSMGNVSEIIALSGKGNVEEIISIATVAADKNMPIVFVPTNGATRELIDFLKKNNIEKTYVIGNEKVVTDNVAKLLPNSERVHGDHMNVAIIDKFYTSNEIENLFVTSNAIDSALVSTLSSKSNSPVLMLKNDISKPEKNLIKSKDVKVLTEIGEVKNFNDIVKLLK